MTKLSKRGFVEGRPKKYTDPKVMEKKIEEFFKDCDSKTKLITNEKGQAKIMLEPYTITGLCLWLDMDRATLLEYEKDPMFSNTVKKAKCRIENWIEKKSLSGELNPTVSIFNLKNNFGWKDREDPVPTNINVYASMAQGSNENIDKLVDVTPDKKSSSMMDLI